MEAENVPTPPGFKKKVLEFRLQRAIRVLVCDPPSNSDSKEDSIFTSLALAEPAEGWVVPDQERALSLVNPVNFIRLVDDDKQKGMSQMFLTDMFARMTVSE